jgi:leucine dehydrogenase
MESLIRNCNGEEAIIRHDKPTGAWAFNAVHSTRLGPAAGRTRLKSYPHFEAALQDALRLFRSMRVRNLQDHEQPRAA